MGSPEHPRSSVKRDLDIDSDTMNDRFKADDEWEGDDKRKHRSSKTRKPGVDEAEGIDSSGKKKNMVERNENRKRLSGSSRADSDEEDYEGKQSRPKQLRKKVEENTLERLSNWYQEGEAEAKSESVSRGYSRTDDTEKRKLASNFSDHESSYVITKDKDEVSQDGDVEKVMDKDSRFSERRESSRDKGHGSSEHGRSVRRRWDDPDYMLKGEDVVHKETSDVISEKPIDSKFDRERSESVKVVDSDSEKGTKSQDREERRAESDRSKRDKFEVVEEDIKGSSLTRSGKDRSEEHRQSRSSSGREVDSRDRPSNAEEDSNAWTREKSRRDMDGSNRSRTPEKSVRRHYESESFDMDYDRNTLSRRKEPERDSYRDDRSKGRDDSWSDRGRDRDSSRESWKRRQPSNTDKEIREIDTGYDHVRDWDLPRRGRADHERLQGRSGGRKDSNRTEAVKTSSKYGISNENYDVIEIQTKPFDYGRDEARSTVAPQSDASASNDEENTYPSDERTRNTHNSLQSGEEKDRFVDDDNDFQAAKGRAQKVVSSGRTSGAQSSSSGAQPSLGSQDPSSFTRSGPQGAKGRIVRGGRGRPAGRDCQQVGLPIPMMGSPFGPLGMPPPGPMQSLTPSMSPAPGPPISPGVFIPPFQPPVWPGARGVDMNMLAVPPGMSPVPPGPSPRFPPNIGTPQNPPMYFNQPGPLRGAPPNIPAPNFSPMGPLGRGQPQDKGPGGWVPPRTNGPPGKAPSRGEQNDYSQNFVDTGMRPQNFIRELELTSVVEDYPKLRELIQKKDEIVAKAASPPMYLKCDLREQALSPELFGTKFDVILVDPPWEEYVHRAPGVTDHMEYWNFEEIMNLKIEVNLWVLETSSSLSSPPKQKRKILKGEKMVRRFMI